MFPYSKVLSMWEYKPLQTVIATSLHKFNVYIIIHEMINVINILFVICVVFLLF